MVRRFAFLLAGLFAFGSAPADGAPAWDHFADPAFVHANVHDLPEAAVMALAQDSAGFLWVGTQGGLARFDGYRVRSFAPHPDDPRALPDGYIRTLLADGDGGVWIGSSSNGLVHYDPSTETFRTWRGDPAVRRGPRSASVDALAATGDGRLWIGGDGGLSRFDPRSDEFSTTPLVDRGAEPVVWALLVDRHGTLWAGTQSGLFERPAGARHFRPFVPASGPRVAAQPVYSLDEDGTGRLWAGSVNVVYGIDRTRRTVDALRSSTNDRASLAPGQQWAITEMTPGVLWVGTDAAVSIVDVATGGVRRVEADPRNPTGLSGGRVVGFLHDRSGMVWLANHVGGLLGFNPQSRGFSQIPATRTSTGLGDDGAVAIAAVAPDGAWVGGFDGRFAHLQGGSQAATTFHLPVRAAIQVLLPAHDGTLWIGTTGGLCRLRTGTSLATCAKPPSRLLGPSIYALLEDRRGLLIGGSTGLLLDDPATGVVAPYPSSGAFADQPVRVLYADRERRLWVGTENGLDRIDSDGRIVRFAFRPGDANSIGPGGMATIIEDRRGRLWAGANGGPLDVLQSPAHGGASVRRLDIADGLPHENVDGLAEDARGRIWASTDRGIAMIDPLTLRARTLGPADGVSDGAFWAGAASRAANGTIFFGGIDGVTVIAPGASSPWSYAPPIVVTAMQVGRRNVPAWRVNRGGATIDVPADARDISVEFAALDFSASETLRYEYKLDGYDADWVEADPRYRVATYTHLSPGHYTLVVRGTNRLGTWTNHELHLSIDVRTPWYETWWFRALLFALVALVGYGVHLVRTSVMRRRQRVLEALVNDRTLELSEANAKLWELSLSDPLTGLRNRRFLDQHLESDIAMTLRRYENWDGDPASPVPDEADILFFLIDLDNFKAVNDRFGHHGGDALLVQMRERLQEVFRESDFVVRWGGDEFLTVARGSARSDAGMLAERIRRAVASRPFSVGGELTVDASVSVGFAAFPFIIANPSSVSWSQVVALADHALYMAKQAGRNAWFGLAATQETDPLVLAPRLDGPTDELVRAASLRVIAHETAAGVRE